MAEEKLYYDLHIHSCLSPCGDDDMTPSDIAGMAFVKGLNIIALTDHNTGKNVPALMEHAERYGILAVPGMELTTAEEIHVLCLFAGLEQLLDFDRYVYERLARVENRPEYFGNQILMDENDNPVGTEPYLLINATSISFDETADLAERFDALMIPAHIEKQTDSLLSVFGQIPPGALFECAEINHAERKEELLKDHPYLKNCNIIHNSDAHSLGHIAEPEHALFFENSNPTAQDVIDVLKKR